jgi:hypothetical protein
VNWKVIAPIGALGVAMGLASVFGLTSGIELWLWVGVWVVAAVTIARAMTGAVARKKMRGSRSLGTWSRLAASSGLCAR